MNTYVILRRSGWRDGEALEKAAAISSKVGTEEMADRVKWLRSYVMAENDGRLGTVCIYQGTDEEGIREHARRAGLPADEVIQVVDTVVIADDA